jgi:hypothetical protein
MRPRFALLIALASSALYASSFTSASCTVGNSTETVTGSTSSSCFVPVFVNGNEVGDAEGNAQVSGSLSGPNGIFVEGSGGFNFSGPSFPDFNVSGGGEASYSQTFASAGPVRPGFLSALIGGFGGTWNAAVTENGHIYDGSGPNQPFELGEEFQVSLGANGGGGTLPCSPGCGPLGGDSSAGISAFQLTEADGTTGVSFFAITPEPASRGFLLFGLAALALFYLLTRTPGLRWREASAPNPKL